MRIPQSAFIRLIKGADAYTAIRLYSPYQGGRCVHRDALRIWACTPQKPHLPQLEKGTVIRQANSSCYADFCQPLQFAVLLPVGGAR